MPPPDLAAATAQNRASLAAVDASLDRAIAAAREEGSRLNCVVAVTEEAARGERRALEGRDPAGLLFGAPLAHKDMFDRAGQPSGWGSPRLAGRPAEHTAPVLRRLQQAGALNMARLHMAELALGPTGHNHHLGRCLNPLAPERISGGSSSGSAAAVAAGIVAGSLGSDTGGSIRIPAAACGIVGLKPGLGRVDMTGCMPLAPSLDCIGPLARHVADCARLFDVIADGATDQPGPAERALAEPVDGLRVAWPQRYYQEGVEASVAGALEAWRGEMERAGWRFRGADLPDQDDAAACNTLVLGFEGAATHADAMGRHPERFGPQVWMRLSAGAAVDPAHYRAIIDARPARQAAFLAAAFGEAEIVATPLFRMPTPTALETEDDDPERVAAILGEISRNTRPASFLGLPALVLPIGRDRNGMPVAVQLIGRPGGEARLLQAGLAIERRSGFAAAA